MAATALFDRVQAFMDAYRLRIPVLLAPMAGACPPALSVAVGRAGGMGACGALLMQPAEIAAWAQEVSAGTDGPFQMNLWIPDPPPTRDPAAEAAVRAFLGQWGPEVPAESGDGAPPDFAVQCQALLDVRPAAISSIMGVYPAHFIAAMKARGIRWFATATTVEEARVAERAGADVIVAQGMEAGGHRGAFEAASAETGMAGLFALLPAIVDAVAVPVVATGGIADGRGVAAALLLGASAVQIGTGFLRSPEAALTSAWADAIGRTLPEQTLVTRAFSGRAGRSVATRYVRAAASPDAPPPAPYPVQRSLTQPLRTAGTRGDDIDRIQAWAGQSAALTRAGPAEEIARDVWEEARALLG